MGVTAEESQKEETAPSAFFTPRGRHRRPRPRKVLLAAGGLALAAGALSLVRLTPDSDVTGVEAADSAPTPALGTDTDLATDAAATPEPPHLKPSPSSTYAMGGLGTTPTTDTIVVPTTNTTAAPRPGASGTKTDDTTAPIPTHHPTAPTSREPAPTPTPTRPAPNPPVPEPTQSDDNAVCVPVIGLCVDPLAKDD
ncbi:hypothetical protein ACQEV2_26935 [Streptomyces sp. CA-251387]|uniref:hypothetical protein n=1 Tax=Streptomyces sp. CA-251387 TaxID=3240064 RepID=UPI003D8CA6B4